MEDVTFEDWPVKGPRTTHWLMDFVERFGGCPLSRHMRWIMETSASAKSPLAQEHEMPSEVLERAAWFDQLDGPNLTNACYAVTKQSRREIYCLSPFPRFLKVDGWAAALSRPFRQTPSRPRAFDRQVTETVLALNFWMCIPLLNDARLLERGNTHWRQRGTSSSAADAPSPEAALDDLLGSLSSDGRESTAPAVSERGLVSSFFPCFLPASGGGQLADYLEESDRRLLVGFEDQLLIGRQRFGGAACG